MQLISCDINGFRRFENVKVNLDSRLLAIVGPNEAGKTSLLDVLSAIGDDDEIAGADLTRGVEHDPGESVIELWFSLDDHERNMANDVPIKGVPNWYVWGKRKNGTRYHYLNPKLHRDKSSREKLVDQLDRTLRNVRLRKELSEYFSLPSDSADKPNEQITLEELIGRVREAADTETENLSIEVIREAQLLRDILGEQLEKLPTTKAGSFRKSVALIEKFARDEEGRHPKDSLADRIGEKRPQVLFFSDDDRQLASDYSIDILNDPPKSLRNLLDLADVDIPGLRRAARTDDHGAVEYIIQKANERLEQQFEDAWQQFRVYVRLRVDQEAIRILLPSAGTYSQIAERSDGLRSFIALYSFISIEAGKNKPILLVDEAEAHLHYDAQADLVRVLENQESAAQVIYTTHSAGCLPNDLGTAVRVIEPEMSDEGLDKSRSKISNSFWEGGPGFSPLLYAMGASVLASVRSRMAVYTEGAADAILFPSLFKEAIDKQTLDFQVLQGLAEASEQDLEELQLEFSRRAYIVDGDEAGRAHAKTLRAAGIRDDEIVALDDGLVTEHLVSPDVYIKAVNKELARSHGEASMISPNDIPGDAVAFAARWCDTRGIGFPKKTKIASHIVDFRRDAPIVNPEYAGQLIDLHRTISSILGKADPG